jgi:hypothetical protein
MKPLLFAAAIGCLLLLAGGCQISPNSAGSTAQPMIEVLETLEDGETIAASDLYPLEPGEWVFAPQASDEQTITWSREQADRFGASIALHRGERRTEFWQPTDDDGVAMPASIDHEKTALTRFEPPLVLTPTELEPGDSFTAESDMRVLDAENTDHQRESGTATRTIEYADVERIRTSQGTFTAARIEVQFTADLNLAEASNQHTYWVVPGRGIVALKLSETIRVLGLKQRPREQTLVRIEFDQ